MTTPVVLDPHKNRLSEQTGQRKKYPATFHKRLLKTDPIRWLHVSRRLPGHGHVPWFNTSLGCLLHREHKNLPTGDTFNAQVKTS